MLEDFLAIPFRKQLALDVFAPPIFVLFCWFTCELRRRIGTYQCRQSLRFSAIMLAGTYTLMFAITIYGRFNR